MKKAIISAAVLGIMVFLLGQGCPGPALPPPVVDAGPDQNIDLGSVVDLEVSVEDGREPFVYQWEQIGGPEAIITSPSASATQVYINTPGTATFRVTVQDANNNSDSDEVSVTVQSLDPGSFTVEAGANQTVNPGEVLNFTAETSNAPGEVVFQWSLEFGGASLANTSQATVTATAPTSSGDSVLRVQAISDEGTASDFVFLKLREALSVVLDESEVTVELGEVASLDALASGGQAPYTFEWIQTGGVSAETQESSTSTSSTLSITLTEAGQATFRVTAIDSLDNTADAQGMVIATADDTDDDDLFVDAGDDVTVDLGDAAILEGTATGGTPPYSYQWTQPSGITAIIYNTAGASTTVITNATGEAVFRLTVTDAEGETDSDEVTVTTQSGGSGNLQVDAGQDQIVSGSVPVNLAGSVSGNTGQVSYAWSLVDWPGAQPVVSFSSSAAASTQVIFANQPNPGDYVFELTVTELAPGLSASDQVTVTVSD